MARKGFKIADAYVEIHADRDGLRNDVKRIPGDVGPDADRAGSDVGKRFGKGLGKGAGPEATRSGRDTGNKLSQGIHLSLVRNSPLIAAAIGAALAVGAPVALAGATLLFGGIGAVAAAQSDKVRSAWVGLWDTIKSGAVEDAAVLVPTFVRMADKIGAGFTRMRPKIRDAFEGIAPLVDGLTDSLLKSAENALPGFVRVIERAGPVMDGFGSFVEDVGSGLTRFFDSMSEHSPAAGAAFASLGDIVEELLPVLGQLLGQGAELASIVLPPVASILGVVNNVLEHTGGLLPAVVLGFTALKIARSAAGWIGTLGKSLTGVAQNLAFASYNGNALAGTAGKLSTAASGVTAAVGPAGAAIGFITAASLLWIEAGKKSEEMTLALGRAFAVGGAQADEASDAIDHFAAINGLLETGVGKAVGSISLFGYSLNDIVPSADDAKSAYDEFVASLDKGGQAQENVKVKTTALKQAVDDYGKSSPQAAAATRELKAAEAEAAAVAGNYEMAIHGVTAAMVEQSNQALSAIDSSFAYRNSVDQLEDAQKTLADTIKNRTNADKALRTTEEDVQRAMLAVEEQNYASAKAFGQQAADLSSAKEGTEEYTRILQQSTLQELYRLRDAAGPQVAAALQQQIDMLEASGLSLTETAARANETTNRMRGLGLAVTQVPGYKGVNINAPTADQRARILDLGYKIVTMPDGSVYVTVDDADARRRLAALTITRTANIVANFIGGINGGATGGQVGKVARGFAGGGSPQRRSDGLLTGPGGALDDLIGAITNTGELIRVANSEWIVPGAVGSQQGSDKMRALVSGEADIVPRGTAKARTQQVVSMQPGGTTLHIGNVTVKVEGVFDLTNPRGLRQLGEKLREVIIGLEREQS